MNYEEISGSFTKGNIVRSLEDGKDYEYCGYLTLLGRGDNAFGYASNNENLVVYKDGKLAEIVEVGVNPDEEFYRHIDNVRRTCSRLGVTPTELLYKDYVKELKQ